MVNVNQLDEKENKKVRRDNENKEMGQIVVKTVPGAANVYFWQKSHIRYGFKYTRWKKPEYFLKYYSIILEAGWR